MTTIAVTAEANSHVKVATASLIGTAIEWYDFFLYGTAAALIFNKLFFPTFDPMIGTLLAFATYALGFVARRWAVSCSAISVTRSDAKRCFISPSSSWAQQPQS
jgi:hypothetical protein